jgi:hypothetical protein
MSRIITLSMVVFITIVAVGSGSPSANAQHEPGNSECDVKWMKSGKSATYQEFMDRCLRLAHGEQLSPADWQQYQRGQRAAVTTFVLPQQLDAQTWCTLNNNCLTPQQQKTQQQKTQQQKKLEDMTIEERANFLFPWAAQGDQRTQYIIDEMRAAADRQQGNSYSIHVK